MQVALYARVSSERQAEQDLSISAQLKALRQYAEKNGWTIYKEFVDEAESARSANRPAFQEMIAYAKRKAFDVILVWKHSRFARNREDAIVYKSLLRKQGVSVISMNEQVDDTPAGKLLEGIIEVIDEFYSLNLAEDTIRGLKENAARGFQNGSIPFGYKAQTVIDGNNKRTKLEPEENSAPIVKRIFQIYLEGKGTKEIAKTLNSEGLKTSKNKAWSSSAIAYIIKNEVYTGTLVYGKKCKHKTINTANNIIRVENNHPAIIDTISFCSAQKIMKTRNKNITHPRETASNYLLSGLLYCGKCGAKMIGCPAKSGKFFYYACHNYSKRGKAICNMRLINKNEIEQFIIERLKTLILTEDNLRELLDIVLDEIKQNDNSLHLKLTTLEKQLDESKNRLDKLYNTLETGKLALDDLAPRIKKLKNEIDELEHKRNKAMEETKKPQALPFGLNTLKEYVSDLASLLKNGTILEQKTFLRSFIKRIVVNLPQVTIEYNLPIIKGKLKDKQGEVLSIGKTGSPGRDRTADQVINSHLLYR